MSKLLMQFNGFWKQGWYKELVKYLSAAVLIAVPLYPKFPLFRIIGSYVSVRLEDLLIFFCFLIFLPYVYFNWKDLLKVNLFRAVAVFLLVGLVSVLSAIVITNTVSPTISFLHLFRRLEYFIPMFIAFLAVKSDRNNKDYFLKLIFIIVGFVIIYALGQRFLRWPMIVTQNQEYAKGLALRWTPGGHINSTFAGHYDLATFLVYIVPIIAATFFVIRDRLVKIICIVLYLSSWWLIAESASRISVVSTVVSVSAALIIIKKYKYIPLVLVIGIVFILLSGNLLSRYKRLIDVTKSGVDKIIYQSVLQTDVYAIDEDVMVSFSTPTPTPVPIFEDRSSSIRFSVEWPRAIRALSKNLLLGTGYSSITLATDNDYLRLLGEVGLFGFLAFFVIFGEILVALLRYHPFTRYYEGTDLIFVGGVAGGILGAMVNAMFIDVFEASKFAIIFWFLIGVFLAIYDEKNTKDISQN